MTDWTRRVGGVLSQAGNAFLGAVAATVATGLVAWAVGGSALRRVLVSSLVGATLVILLLAARLHRNISERLATRRYLSAPLMSSSQHLPVGPSPQGTPIGRIITRQGLLVPQPWHSLSDLAEHSTDDLAHHALSAIETGSKILIVGEPGIGKTLTISRIFHLLAQRYLDDPSRRPIPVFVHLGDVDVSEPNVNDRIFNAIARQVRLKENQVRRLVQKRRLIAMLDGLDEASGISSAASLRATLASDVFEGAQVVTARRDFIDLHATTTEIATRYPLQVELERFPFGTAISTFVHTYCSEFRQGDPSGMIRAIEAAPELKDLVTRPLTLWMVVDVLAGAPADLVNTRWTLTALYQRYTGKWLEREVTRPGARVDRVDEKRTLVRLAARAMYQGGTAVGGATRSTTEMAVSRDQLAESLLGSDTGVLISDTVRRLGLRSVLDELCLRTFLVRGDEDGHRFAHKSFFEYFVALDMFECIGREGRLDTAANYFSRPLSDPVVYFFREMLSLAQARPNDQRLLCQNMTSLLTRHQNEAGARSQTIRQHVGNMLAGVADEITTRFLVDYAEQESSEFVRRGIIIGLGFQQNRTDLVDKYVRRLRQSRSGDAAALSVHLGYTRIYHGDQDWSGQWEDDGTPEVRQTIEAQIDRLLASNYRYLNERLWVLTLFTLRALLEDGRGLSYVQRYAPRRDALIEFLRTPQPKRGELFEDERQRVLNILECAT